MMDLTALIKGKLRWAASPPDLGPALRLTKRCGVTVEREATEWHGKEKQSNKEQPGTFHCAILSEARRSRHFLRMMWHES